MQPSYQEAVDQVEMQELVKQWGALPIIHHQLQVDDPFLTGEDQLLVSNRRRAEICYIMHRGNIADGLLLHIKSFYPAGAFRLPTGGIHQDEAVMETLAREIEEETGMVVGPGTDQVEVQRCLGVIGYAIEHRSARQTFPYATYCFLVQMPEVGVLAPRDADELIVGWQWRRPDELYEVAAYLEQVGRSTPDWGDWGRYRAISHRFVAERLLSRE